ncbi:down syndrome cell adhesion molecule [Trichonephila clavipes]|nr:down syndrome cell adhesion molecule [Trichonephila clavipes]
MCVIILQYSFVLSDSWKGHTSQLIVSGSDSTAVLRALHPVTTYHLRVIAENTIGKSRPSGIINVTTQVEAPSGPPRELAVHPTGDQSLKVTWKIYRLKFFKACSFHGEAIKGGLRKLTSKRPFEASRSVIDNLVALHFKYDQARRRFVEWAQNEIAVVPDFHKRILFSDETHFWLNGYVNKQNCRIWSEANPQVYVETPLHPEKLTVWCALWAGGILLQKTMKATTLQSMVIGIEP